jgi:hypothetical protein
MKYPKNGARLRAVRDDFTPHKQVIQKIIPAVAANRFVLVRHTIGGKKKQTQMKGNR